MASMTSGGWSRRWAAIGAAVVVLAVLGSTVGWRLGVRQMRSEQAQGHQGESTSGSGSTSGNQPSGGGRRSPAADPYAACHGFLDQFDGSSLDQSWELTQNAKALVVGGSLELTANDGADIYEDKLAAPMLLRVPSGDFTLETDVTVTPAYTYQGAGLLLWNGSQSYVRLERGFGDVGAIAFEYRNGGKHTKIHSPFTRDGTAVPTDAPRVQLRLHKAAGAVSASWRAYGSIDWTGIGSAPVALPDGTKVGVAVLNRSQDPKPDPAKKPITARFDYVKVSCG
jgi:Beta xylosidase C-terminal Concanavalin A-like domain